MTVAWVAYGLGWVLMLRLAGNDFYHSPDMPDGVRCQGMFWASLGPAAMAATFWPVVVLVGCAWSAVRAAAKRMKRMKSRKGAVARLVFGGAAWWEDSDKPTLKKAEAGDPPRAFH